MNIVRQHLAPINSDVNTIITGLDHAVGGALLANLPLKTKQNICDLIASDASIFNEVRAIWNTPDEEWQYSSNCVKPQAPLFIDGLPHDRGLRPAHVFEAIDLGPSSEHEQLPLFK